MKVIAVSEINTGPGSAADQSGLTEAARVLLDLHDRGILKTVYLRKDRPGTVLVLECGTEEDAHKYMSALPGVQKGTTTYQLILLGSEIPPNALLATRLAAH